LIYQLLHLGVANFVSGIKSTPSMPFLDCYLGTKFVGLMDLNFKSFDSLYFQQIKCHPMGKKKKNTCLWGYSSDWACIGANVINAHAQ
jgi:hypothetical protein